MADDHRTATAHRRSLGSLLRPTALCPRLLIRTLADVTRSTRHRRTAGTQAVCPTAAEHRSCPVREDESGSGSAKGPRCGENLPDAPDPRERAHEAVVSRTTSPDDLASLLAMLDLRPGPDGTKPRTGDREGHPGRGDG
ncbi:hypothetical protein [Streptomyces subrutilus]|uniref:Uncharacterized protein n=1 Tax=Streptomyces subrutilus TaxID=36818 RepID=A0A1E5PLE9_9ACTN|nr:hypothetical protein [Streptomyces subrutilus]OEJ30406.1 hypothetical protein BGK67_02695 [Streptomyces subrutilus]